MIFFLAISSGDPYFCTKFRENILDSIKVTAPTRFLQENISKGYDSVNTIGGIMVLFLCTLSDDGLYLYKVS